MALARDLQPRWSVRSLHTDDDFARLVPLGHRFYAEASIPGEFSANAFMASLRTWKENMPCIVLGLECNGNLVGAIAGVIITYPFDGCKVLNEVFWYVDPSCRGHGIRLYKELERWAVANKVKRITMGHLIGEKAEAMSKYLLRKGYQPLEIHYSKELS